ncbi:DNA polymerase III subunit gamma/tau [Alteromonas gilva]|uniref:DNA-directed DNA polymerase n=1 Tax=Alteromonas gilva TaxID=2987522 RepID=A0ABT5L4M6_9ALTE|nr:DNA polymerase III subunit gamma/tau [Alteromonas gilva]MDC8831812.1 DNA polymerase III subunit gamma/tau [Alteromonas gilva]
MAYQVLARKWRPGIFSELVGQEHVVSAISNALTNDRLHHAYLFTGTRGVGKTTIARIFSKSLNCEQGQSATPCGQCSTCVEIEQGNYVDLLEIDAASRTKVEDTRELLDNVQYKPSRGRFKVYLIDEVHMLSKHSFNALLKTLEEPPPHVKFLLATTDPQKLPVTILSRCLQFNLKALSREQISQQLHHILAQEQISFEDNALTLLAKAAQGSMRDALSLTDQAIAQGNNQVSSAIVTDMLGLMDRQQLLKILFAVTKREPAEVMAQAAEIDVLAPDYSNVLAELSSLLHQIALTQWVPEACKLETNTAKAIYQLARHFAPEQVQLLYQITLQGRKDLPYASDARSAFEMTLLRMMSFAPAEPLGDRETLIQQAPARVVETQDAEADMASATAAQAHQQSGDFNASEHIAEAVHSAADDDLVTGASGAMEHAQINPSEAQDISDTHHDESQQLGDEAAQLLDEAEDYRRQSAHFTDHDDHQHHDRHQDNAQYSQFDTSNNADTDAAQGTADPAPPQSGQQVGDSPGPDAADEPRKPAASNTAAMLALRQRLKQQAAEEKANAAKKPATSADGYKPPVANRSATTPTPAEPRDNAEQPGIETQEQAVSSPATPQPDNSKADTPGDDFDAPPPWVLENTGDDTSADSAPGAQTGSYEEPEQWSEQPVQTTDNLHSGNPSGQQPATEAEASNSDTQQAARVQNDLNNDANVSLDDYTNLPAYLENGDKLLKASQLDSWSRLIEAMPVAGLLKQVALHSLYARDGNEVTLTLDSAQQHLVNDTTAMQLSTALEEVLQSPVQVTLEYGSVSDTPFQIQQQINIMRERYARQVIQSDDVIQSVVQAFNASVLDDSIQPR